MKSKTRRTIRRYWILEIQRGVWHTAKRTIRCTATIYAAKYDIIWPQGIEIPKLNENNE